MKRVICILLTFVMLLSIPLSVAAAGDKCTCGCPPVIHVRGIGSDLYLNPESEDRVLVFPPVAEDIVEPLKLLPAAIAKSVATSSWDSVSKGIVTVAQSIFKYLMCDENGNSIYNIGVLPNKVVSAQNHKNGSNRMTFNYDWRLDPMVTADGLSEFIERACDSTGHDKVILECHSEGGIILTAYLSKYGHDKVEKAQMVDSAAFGLTLMGRLYTGEVEFNKAAISAYLAKALPENLKFVNILVDLLDIFGSLDKLVDGLNILLDNCWNDVYTGVVRDIFGRMPALWGFVSDQYYEKAITGVFAGESRFAALEARLDSYHYNGQMQIKTMLTDAIDDNVGIAIVSCYGYPPMPFTKDCTYVTDSLVDSANTSGGASFAPYGSTFGENYVQAVKCGHNHISPDKDVDASTCILPEHTWFVKNQTHWNLPYELLEFIQCSDNDTDIHTSAEFPQFLVAVDGNRDVAPNIKTGDEEKTNSVWEIIKEVLKYIFSIARGLIANIF